MARDNNGRKRGKGGVAVGGAAVVLAALYLLGGRGGFGFGNGFGIGAGDQSGQTPSVQAGEAQTSAADSGEASAAEQPGDDGVLSVTVTENGCLYEGAEITAEELSEALLRDYAEGKTVVEVRDDHSIKDQYDEIIALLESLDIPYEEKQ